MSKASKFNNQSVTKPWHKPACTMCKRPIEDIADAYAGFYTDKQGKNHHPQLVHAHDSGCRYYHRWPNGHIAGELMLGDIPVSHLRRAPMEAICIAMQRGGETEAERLVWHAWLSAVLGLPFATWDHLMMMQVHDEVGEYVCERVLTVDEAVRDIGSPIAGRAIPREPTKDPAGIVSRFKIVAIYSNGGEREVHAGPVPNTSSENTPLNVDIGVDGERWNFYFQRIGATNGDGDPF